MKQPNLMVRSAWSQQSGSSLPASSQGKTSFVLSVKHVFSKGQFHAGGWDCGESYINPGQCWVPLLGVLLFMIQPMAQH